MPLTPRVYKDAEPGGSFSCGPGVSHQTSGSTRAVSSSATRASDPSPASLSSFRLSDGQYYPSMTFSALNSEVYRDPRTWNDQSHISKHRRPTSDSPWAYAQSCMIGIDIAGQCMCNHDEHFPDEKVRSNWQQTTHCQPQQLAHHDEL